jgi:hypothetical protein
MYSVMRRATLLAFIATAVVACTPGHHSSVTPSSPTTLQGADPLARLRASLPAGFGAPGSVPPRALTADLPVAPAAGFQPSQVTLAPLPDQAHLRQVVAAVINLPVPVDVRPLFASTTALRAGAQVTFAGAHLSPGHHTVLFILDGPDYRGQHLVAADNGVAAGIVTLPATMAAGAWYFAIEDQAGVAPTVSGAPVGAALVDIGAFTVA